MIMKSNYFFILNPSPWPLICSIGASNLLLSILIFFKFSNFSAIFFSVTFLCLTSFYWWLSYSKEFSLVGMSSSCLEGGLKFSMILFISSEVFFFFSFFWTYFHYFLSPPMEIGTNWPPTEILPFNYMNVPLINTLFLLSSGVTITVSHNFLLKENNSKFSIFLVLTIFLGFSFMILQILEYSYSFFSLSDSSFGSSFFILTGFHGLHVIIGVIFLMSSLFIASKMISNSSNMLSFELSSWYWHFVDVVWIFLYFFLYYMNS